MRLTPAEHDWFAPLTLHRKRNWESRSGSLNILFTPKDFLFGQLLFRGLAAIPGPVSCRQRSRRASRHPPAWVPIRARAPGGQRARCTALSCPFPALGRSSGPTCVERFLKDSGHTGEEEGATKANERTCRKSVGRPVTWSVGWCRSGCPGSLHASLGPTCTSSRVPPTRPTSARTLSIDRSQSGHQGLPVTGSSLEVKSCVCACGKGVGEGNAPFLFLPGC